jgi:hypothetical protein
MTQPCCAPRAGCRVCHGPWPRLTTVERANRRSVLLAGVDVCRPRWHITVTLGVLTAIVRTALSVAAYSPRDGQGNAHVTGQVSGLAECDRVADGIPDRVFGEHYEVLVGPSRLPPSSTTVAPIATP